MISIYILSDCRAGGNDISKIEYLHSDVYTTAENV